jgi:hypothetical protein
MSDRRTASGQERESGRPVADDTTARWHAYRFEAPYSETRAKDHLVPKSLLRSWTHPESELIEPVGMAMWVAAHAVRGSSFRDAASRVGSSG